jgi:hypothetical protein
MLITDAAAEAVLGSRLKLSETQWADYRNNLDLSFSADEAVACGLTQQVEEFMPRLEQGCSTSKSSIIINRFMLTLSYFLDF